MSIWRPDPTFYPSPKMAMDAPAGKAGVRRHGQRKWQRPSRRDGRRGRRPGSPRATAHLVGQVDMPQCRRRAAPFRLERMQRLPVPVRAASARGAPLSGRAGHPLVAHPHHRYQARSAQTANRESDRAGDAGRAHRIRIAAHGPLRSRRNLMSALGASGRRRPRRSFRDGSRELRRAREMGAGSRSSELAYDFWWHLGWDTSLPANGERPTW